MLQAVLLLTLIYLPGHLLGRRLARKDDSFSDVLLLRVAASVALASPLLTLLALAGWFTVPALLGTFGVCALAAFAISRREGVWSQRWTDWTRWDTAAISLVAGSLALYGRPAEYVFNHRDPGVYALFADRLARTGALLHRDALVAAVSSFHPFLEGKKYPGFYIYGQDLIVPQFFPGPFAFLGLGDLIGGLWGGLFVVPVMGALAVGMAYALGEELFGRWAGLVGASLLALSYAQVWWARQPASEIMTQLSVLAGLWLGVRFARGAGPITGVLSGLLLGGVMLVRVDAFLAAAAVPLLFAYDLLTHRPAWRWLYPGVPLALFAGATVLYLNTVGARYLYVIYAEHGLREALTLAPYAAIAAGLMAVAFLYVRARWGRGIGTYLGVRGGRYALGFAMCLVAVALWAYFLLPVPWDALPDGSRDFGAYRTQVLVRLVWFTTPVVAALGLVGFALTAWRLDAARVLVLGAFLGFGVLYAAVPNVSPDLPWATRRFVPAAFPILSLLAGYAAVEAGRWLGRAWRPRVGVALSITLVVCAIGWTVYTAAPILGHREFAGAVAGFERVEREIPDAEVVFMEMPDGFDVTASTFEYAYGHPVLPYDRLRFVREIDELDRAGLLDDAVYITTDGGPAPLLSDVDFRQVGSASLNLPTLSAVEKELPTQRETLSLNYRVFRVEGGA